MEDQRHLLPRGAERGNVISIDGRPLASPRDGITLLEFWDLMDHWQENLIAKGLADSTRADYDSFLLKLFRETRSTPDSLGERQLMRFIDTINPKGQKAQAITRAGRSYFSWAHRRAIHEDNPFEDVRPKPVKYPPAKELMPDEARAVVAEAFDRDERRGWAIILLFETGPRIGSLAAVEPGDVGTQAGEPIRFRIAKGDRPYVWWLTPLAAEAVRRLLALPTGAWHDGHTLIGVTKMTLGRWFHEAAVDAGLPPGKRNAHLARSTFATELFRRTHDDRIVQRGLNHASRALLHRYTALADDEAQGAMGENLFAGLLPD